MGPSRFLTGLAARAPILAGGDQVTYVDVDDTIKATHGYTKQGAGYGYSGVKGLNALIATISTPLSAPVVATTRLRKGSTNSARGAARLVVDALATTTACGGTQSWANRRARPRKGCQRVVVLLSHGLLSGGRGSRCSDPCCPKRRWQLDN